MRIIGNQEVMYLKYGTREEISMKEKSKNKPGNRFLSFILALAILPAMQAFPAWAGEAVSNPSVDLQESEETVYAAGEGQPANPVHHCTKGNDGTDYTDWSYINFGSYPQTEVTGGDLTSAITGASYDANGDAWVEGTKYRRISKSDTCKDDYFGGRTYRYFMWEPIKWKVLQNDGSTLFVMADQGMDCKLFNDEWISVTWENCTLRSWLNSTFFSAAFSAEEQEAVAAQTVVMEDNPEYNIEGGNDTLDKVYLLSTEEVTSPSYGFCEDYSTYSVSRRVGASDFANAMGAWISPDKGYQGNSQWLLRSPGGNTKDAAVVEDNGYVQRNGYMYNEYDAVVPVLHINLSSDCWSAASGESHKKPPTPGPLANPVHYCTKEDDGTDYTEWSYVYFGSYPQTEVTGSALTPAITGANYDANGDAWVDGIKYCRIGKKDSAGNITYHYFKWERIKWKVLQMEGSTLFLMADRGLDGRAYNYHAQQDSITWENCSLRRWLNDTFYRTAFSRSEQEAVVPWTVANGDNPQYGTEGGNDTGDKVYLLSIGEAAAPSYGFCEDWDIQSASRRVEGSDFYACVGGVGLGDDGSCEWRLRSPGQNAYASAYVRNGYVDRKGSFVIYDNYGVVPVLHINLSSGLWHATDDGTSGEGGGLDGQEQGGDSQPPTDASQEQGGDSQPPTDTSQKPGGDDNQGQQEVKVKKISISGISKKIAAGKKISLKTDVSPKNAANPKIKWETNNKCYAAVNSRGVVTTKKAGKGKTVTIKAMATDGSKVKASYKIKLMKHAVTKVKIKKVPKNLKAGKSILLKTTVQTNGKNANKALKWSTSNKKYASVDSKGKVKTKKAGKGKTVTITATATDGSNKKASVRLKIK